MKMRNSKKKAFTIVELIIVIAVIGILAAILIPAFTNMIAKANAKSALSDARNTLTAYLAENLEVVDGQIASSIVIFVKKAKMYYVFGYSTTGPEMGKLMQSIGNPFHYEELAELINDYNCTDFTEEQIIGMEPEELAEFAFFLRTTPSGSGSGLEGTKGASMEDINSQYVNLSGRMADGLPDTTEVFDGFLIGMIVDAGIYNPGGGTHPGGIPGGGGGNPGGNPGGDPTTGPGGEDPADGKFALAVNVVPENAATAVITPAEASNMYNSGSKVTISFTQTTAQAEQYSFIRYSVSGVEVSTNTTYTVTMNANKAVVINFSAGAWDGTEDPNDDFGGGSGTSGNPYIITTPQQLFHLSKKVEGGTTYSGKYFIVANDINLNEGTVNASSTGANVWLPIGKNTAFKGSFDGQGHTISGIYIVNTASSGTYLALFGYTDGATIKNVNVANSYIKGYQRIAGIVGTTSVTTITNCSADIILESANTTDTMIGGIVGRALDSTITHCASFGNINSSGNANGGIVGMCASGGNIVKQCINKGNISGKNNLGGIVGYDNNCDMTVDECVNLGNISGAANIGGLVGNVMPVVDSSTVKNSYNMGTVHGTGQYIGGMVGLLQYSYLTNCYNVGTITSNTSNYSAATGGKNASCSTTNNYYLNTSCGQTTSSGTSKTEAEMKAIASTLGASYRDDSTPNINDGYPILKWQSDAPIDKPIPGGGGGTDAPATYTLMYMDGNTFVASFAFREGDKAVLRAALQKEGYKFQSWKYDGNTYMAGSQFTMPANDVTMTADWLKLPAGEYYYEARYVVGSGENYETFATVTGTAPEGATYTPSQAIVNAVNPNYSIINTAPFTVQAHNDNIFVIYCAEGISSAEQFNAIRNNLGGSYFLLNDIDVSGYPTWTAIGTTQSPFTGSLNGNGFTISGIATSTQSAFQGLFGTNGGIIESLRVVSNNMAVGTNSGILAAHNTGTIRNCSTSGILRAGSNANLWQLGGIVGTNGGLVDQCWSDATITATTTSQNYFGGLVGENLETGTISNSYFCGSVTGARSSGLVGYMHGNMINCYTIGRVNTMNDTWARPTIGEGAQQDVSPYGPLYTMIGCVVQPKLLSRNGSTAYTGWDSQSGALLVSDALMRTASTYASLNWDTSIWNIVEGQLPTLKNTPRATPPVANPWP